MSSLRQRRRTPASPEPTAQPTPSPTSNQLDDDEDPTPEAQPPSVLPLVWRALTLLGFIAATQIAGLVLFTKGFLLTRTELKGVAQCAPTASTDIDTTLQDLVANDQATPSNWSKVLDTHGECTVPARFNRSLLFVVDALRYDFVTPARTAPSNATDAELDAVINQLAGGVPVIQALQAAHPHHTLLAHFAADPPTTTLQRLKALTTGVLPTFIDAGSNFGATEIGEDNLLSQLRTRSNGTAGMGFMGDDTWLSLFPESFDSQWTWPYDSFHVEDLDTVDRGVQSHLRAFLDPTEPRTTEASNWSLLIAHQLGLDHAGHRYGPGHAEFSRKLKELDDQVRFISDRLPDDALLVFMGDHGMDAKGDHGGDGELETAAAFFAYAKQPLTAPLPQDEPLRYSTLPKGQTTASFGSVEGGFHFGPGQYVATATNLTVVGEGYFAFFNCGFGHQCEIYVTDDGASFSGPSEDSYVFSEPRDDLPTTIPFFPNGLRDDGIVRTVLGAPDEYVAFRPLGNEVIQRSIQQIDFVPSLALLLGIPIPFNSLGTIIPELFANNLLRALRINAQQVRTYLRRYISQAGEINRYLRELDAAWLNAARADWIRAAIPTSSSLHQPLTRAAEQAYFAYTRLALARAKEVWAQFDLVAMGAGLTLLVLGTLSAFRLRAVIGYKDRPTAGLHSAAAALAYAAGYGFLVSGPVIAIVLGALGLYNEVSVLELFPAVRTRNVLGFMFSIQLVLSNVILLGQVKRTYRALVPHKSTLLPLAIVLVHALSLGSNSFIAWEDHTTSTLLQVSLVLTVAAGARIRFPSLFRGTAQEKANAQKDLLRSGALAVLGIILSRFLRSIRVCREEQAPYCQTTFYARLVSAPAGDTAGNMTPAAVAATAIGSSTNSLWASVAAVAVGWWLVPTFVRLAAALTDSDTRLVQLYVKWVVRTTLVFGALYWILDTLSAGATTLRPSSWSVWSNALKRPLAILEICATLALIVVVWPNSPLPLELRMERVPAQTGQQPGQRAVLTGVRNLLGIHYLLLVLFVSTLIFLLAQPMGQVTLGLIIVVILNVAEITGGGPGTLREWGKLETVNWGVLVTLHLLSNVAFFATGHQASVPSIQWRSAFVGFRTLTYPFAPIFVTINTLGPSALVVLAVPLVVLWRHAPKPRGMDPDSETKKDDPMPTLPYLARASLGYVGIASIPCVAATIFATIMRRHLMLFKVWAPRYMLAGLTLGTTHIVLICGVLAASWVCYKTTTVLGTAFEAQSYNEFEVDED